MNDQITMGIIDSIEYLAEQGQPAVKRQSPRARGRVGAIFKPFANLTIVVREVEAQA